MITPEKVRELLEAATPGPWKVDSLGRVATVFNGYLIANPLDPLDNNAGLLAAAPEIAAAYLDAIEALRLLQDGIGEIRTEIIKDM